MIGTCHVQKFSLISCVLSFYIYISAAKNVNSDKEAGAFFFPIFFLTSKVNYLANDHLVCN